MFLPKNWLMQNDKKYQRNKEYLTLSHIQVTQTKVNLIISCQLVACPYDGSKPFFLSHCYLHEILF